MFGILDTNLMKPPQAYVQFLRSDQTHARIAFLPHVPIRLRTAKPPRYPVDPKTLGEHIRRRRMILGLRQKDAATQLGCGRFTIVGWEKNQKHPEVRFIPAILKFLEYDPFPAPASLSERIKLARIKAGLSQRALAEQLKIDHGTLWRYETGQWHPKGKHLQRVIEYLREARII